MGHNFKMKQWVRDLIYGIVLVVFAVGNIIYANTLPPGSIKIKAAQAGTYLAIVMIMLGILGICLIVRSLSQKSQKECSTEPLWLLFWQWYSISSFWTSLASCCRVYYLCSH